MFVGITGSGSGTVTATSLNGPLPSLGSSAAAPVVLSFPGQSFAYFVASVGSNTGSLQDGLMYLKAQLGTGALRGQMLPFSFGGWDQSAQMTPDALLSWSVVGNFVLFKAFLKRIGWLGIAVSPSGIMVQPGTPYSDAVIFMPLAGALPLVQQYKLTGRDPTLIIADTRFVVCVCYSVYVCFCFRVPGSIHYTLDHAGKMFSLVRTDRTAPRHG